MQPGDTADDPAAGEGDRSAVSPDGESAAVAPGDSSTDDGDDVASRNPDAIAFEIEQTRAELASTIDAIADRMSPKRAAARSAEAVKSQVSSAREKVVGGNGSAALNGNQAGASSPTTSSPLPVVPIAAVVAFLTLLAVVLRRRRSR